MDRLCEDWPPHHMRDNTRCADCPRNHSALLMYEDELPEDITDAEYNEWYARSWVDGVRLGPVFDRKRNG